MHRGSTFVCVDTELPCLILLNKPTQYHVRHIKSSSKIAVGVLLWASARVSDTTDVFAREPERQQLRNQKDKKYVRLWSETERCTDKCCWRLKKSSVSFVLFRVPSAASLSVNRQKKEERMTQGLHGKEVQRNKAESKKCSGPPHLPIIVHAHCIKQAKNAITLYLLSARTCTARTPQPNISVSIKKRLCEADERCKYIHQ